MSSILVPTLRALASAWRLRGWDGDAKTTHDAADEIEALQARVDELTESLLITHRVMSKEQYRLCRKLKQEAEIKK